LHRSESSGVKELFYDGFYTLCNGLKQVRIYFLVPFQQFWINHFRVAAFFIISQKGGTMTVPPFV
jgi:hypothetical protein